MDVRSKRRSLLKAWQEPGRAHVEFVPAKDALNARRRVECSSTDAVVVLIKRWTKPWKTCRYTCSFSGSAAGRGLPSRRRRTWSLSLAWAWAHQNEVCRHAWLVKLNRREQHLSSQHRNKHRHSQAVQWVHLLHPLAEKKIRHNLQGKFLSAPPSRARVNFRTFVCWAGEIWSVGVVHLVVLACVLRSTSRRMKRWSTFLRKKVHT